MKWLSLFKRVSVWFVLIAIVFCTHDDFKHIFTIGLNPILSRLVYVEPYRDWIMDTSGTIYTIKWFGYLLIFVTSFLYGLIFDVFIVIISYVMKFENDKENKKNIQ